MEEGDAGGHGPRTCRSAVKDENVDSGKRDFEAGSVCLVFHYRASNSSVFMSGNAHIQIAISHALCIEKPGCSQLAYVSQGVSVKTRVAFRAN